MLLYSQCLSESESANILLSDIFHSLYVYIYQNDEQNAVQPSERVVIDADGGAIHFKPLQKGDEGNYRCMASNDVGSDSASGFLYVQGD